MTYAQLLATTFIISSLCTAASSSSALSLDDAIQLTLQNNLTIQSQDLGIALGNEAVNIAEAKYVPAFFSSVNYEDLSRRQNAIEFTSTGELNFDRIFEEDNLRTAVGVRHTTVYGTQLEVGLQAAKLENTITRSGGASLFDPEYQSSLNLSLLQPLLKNFSKDSNLIEKNLALLSAEKSKEEYELAASNQIVELLNVFYDCLFGQENLAAKHQSVAIAKALMGSNQRRKDAGQMSALDVAIANVRVSEAEEEAWLAESFLNDRKSTLLKLLGTRDFQLSFEVEGQIKVQHPTLDTPSLIKNAFTQRPDIQIALAAIKEEQARSSYANNQALPELNLSVSYGLNGLEDSTSNSIDRALEDRESDLRIGLNLEIPLSNKGASAAKRAATYAVQRANIELQQLKAAISIDVQNSVKRFETILQRIEAAKRSLAVAKQALDAEQKRLDSGQSTTFDVIQLQETMSSANTRVLASQVDAIKALNQVYAITGQLSQKHGFTLSSSF